MWKYLIKLYKKAKPALKKVGPATKGFFKRGATKVGPAVKTSWKWIKRNRKWVISGTVAGSGIGSGLYFLLRGKENVENRAYAGASMLGAVDEDMSDTQLNSILQGKFASAYSDLQTNLSSIYRTLSDPTVGDFDDVTFVKVAFSLQMMLNFAPNEEAAAYLRKAINVFGSISCVGLYPDKDFLHDYARFIAMNSWGDTSPADIDHGLMVMLSMDKQNCVLR